MSAPEGGGAWISSGKIYDELRKLNNAVVELSVQVRQANNQDARITALERRVWWLSGAAAVAGAAINQVIIG